MTRSEYPAIRTISTRWEDEDVYGHVNNVVYYSFFDTAVNGYLIDATGVDIRQLDTYGIVAETSCRFLRELRFPGDVEAGLKVTKLGTSSVVYEIALFQGEDDDPAAVGTFVHVYVSGPGAEAPSSSTARAVTPIPDLIRTVLEPLTAAPA